MANNNIALHTTKVANLALQRFVENLYGVNYIRKDITAEELSANETVKVVLPTSDFESKAFDPNVGIELQDITSNTVDIKVDQWRDVSFVLNDKEMLEIDSNRLIEQKFADGMEAHAKEINTRFYNLYKSVYQVSGTGTANPYKSDDIRNATKTLSKALVRGQKTSIVSSDTFYDIVNEAAKYNNTGSISAGAYVNATLPAVGGAPLLEDQLLNELTHVAGTATAGAVTVNAPATAGDTSIALDTVGATDTFVEGDLINIAGQSYVITADATAVANVATVSISPALKADAVATEAVETVGDHDVNLMFSPSFAVFVMRSLLDASKILGVQDSSVVGKTIIDPNTNIPLRYALKRDFDNKSWKFSMDILYTIALLDARYACRILNS